jgi:hypothetical protein
MKINKCIKIDVYFAGNFVKWDRISNKVLEEF